MSLWCVIASGPSLTAEQVSAVRERCKIVAVSDAWFLVPDADILVAADAAWWLHHKEAMSFPGRKVCNAPPHRGMPEIERIQAAPWGINSGLLGIMAAVSAGARRVLLLGIDMHSPGEHFFGRHPAPLKSTDSRRQDMHRRQFENYRPRKIDIINCTPGSALACYPTARLEDCLSEPAIHAA